MITRNHRGDITRTTRSLNLGMNAHILAGADWQSVAHVELIRLHLEASASPGQLEGRPGYDELGRAVMALKEAHMAIENAEDSAELNY